MKLLSYICLKEKKYILHSGTKLLKKLLLTFQERLEEGGERDWNTRHECAFIVPHVST